MRPIGPKIKWHRHMSTETTQALPSLAEETREKILSQPGAILDDKELMRALVGENERIMGGNVIDMRGLAMERLEARLDRLEDTHRSVISAAYENLAGTNQIHRAVLRLLDPVDFNAFLAALRADMPEILRVDALALVLETEQAEGASAVETMGDVLKVMQAGFCEAYLNGQGSNGLDRPVLLRQIAGGSARIYGDKAVQIRSEACLRLNLGEGRLPGMLILGSEDSLQFTPQHGTDLLTFFGGVFERTMRRWLA